MRIGELAQRVGLRASAIRHYERVGVLEPARRIAGRRDYGAKAVNALKLLQAAQRAGFTLAEARVLLGPSTDGSLPSKRWREAAEGKLQDIDADIARLQSAKAALVAALECACAGDAEACVLVAETSVMQRRPR